MTARLELQTLAARSTEHFETESSLHVEGPKAPGYWSMTGRTVNNGPSI